VHLVTVENLVRYSWECGALVGTDRAVAIPIWIAIHIGFICDSYMNHIYTRKRIHIYISKSYVYTYICLCISMYVHMRKPTLIWFATIRYSYMYDPYVYKYTVHFVTFENLHIHVYCEILKRQFTTIFTMQDDYEADLWDGLHIIKCWRPLLR